MPRNDSTVCVLAVIPERLLVFTDALGLLLFLPPVRELVWRFLRSRIVVVDAAYSRGTAGFRRDGSRTIDLDADDFARKDGPPPRRPLLDGDD